MDDERVIKWIETKTNTKLTELQKAILKGTWYDRTYVEIAESLRYDLQYVKDVGYELWELLSEICGEKIAKKTFRTKLEHLDRNLAPFIHYRRDWGDAPDVPIFFGRSAELATLEQWILRERCRLVAIVGMRGIGKTQLSLKLGKGGIGKTDLSLKLARGIENEFAYIMWRSLLNAPPVTDILIDAIEFLSNQQETEIPPSLETQISRLLHYLKEHRCLLILDNAETILASGSRAGEYRQGYEGYAQLFGQIAAVPHQSCLLLTSREKPHNLWRVAGKTHPVRFLELGGLDYLDGQKIFQEIGDFVGSDAEWQTLIELYNGNPLALELAAHHIQDIFGGHIGQFLREGKPIFDDLRDLLDWHFDRLSEPEKEIMYWLAINREPISLTELQEDLLFSSAKERVTNTLQSLSRRSPLERSAAGFSLQPVLIEYVTEAFIAYICREIETGKIALLNNHALLKALAKDYLRETQIRLILQPILERLLKVLGSKKGIEAQLALIIGNLRDKFEFSGYSAGNLLNLLCQLQTDLSGYDFSHQIIWQAYLQGMNLTGVNFTDAEFAKSVFTQSFGGIQAVAFSPDGQLLAAGDSQGQILLFRVEDGQTLVTLPGHGKSLWVTSLNFSPDGQTLVSGGFDQMVRLWNLSTGECLHILTGHSSWVWSVAFSPDGKIIASASDDRTVRLWDVSTGQCLRILTGHTHWVWSVAFNPDGNILASGSYDRTIKLWDVNTGQCVQTLQGHEDSVWSVDFSPDGELLVSGSVDRTLKLWDVSSGECLQTIPAHTKEIRSVAFSPNGKIVASGGYDRTIKLWDISSGQCLKTLFTHAKEVRSIAFSPDGKIIAGGTHNQTIRFWDVKTGQCLKTWQGHTNWIWSVAISPDDRTIASGSLDSKIRLWHLNTGECWQTLEGHTNWVWSVVFSPDGKTIASGSDDETIKIWDVKTGQCLQTWQGHTNGGVWSLSFSRDGKILVSGGQDGTVRLWDVARGECFKILQGHSNWIWSVSCSPDDRTLATCSDDRTVKLWDLQTGEFLQTLPEFDSKITTISWSQDGKFLASGHDNGLVKLWDLHSGRCLKTLAEHTMWVFSLAVSPQDRIVASASQDTTIKLWDIDSGQCLKTLPGHTDWVRSIVFNFNGQTLMSGSIDETIKLWNVQTGNCLKTLRIPRPYEGMKLIGVRGLTNATIATLKAIGASA